MILGIFGKMGSGKTLMMTMLASALKHEVPDIKLFSNYNLNRAEIINSTDELIKITDGVVALDEFWVSMDSRVWKDNVFLTRWINQTRKKNLLVLYTTQAFGQIDIRVRNATDLLIFCERFSKAKTPFFRYSFIDNFGKTILKSFKILESQAENFYDFYDSFEIVRALTKKQYGFKADF